MRRLRCWGLWVCECTGRGLRVVHSAMHFNIVNKSMIRDLVQCHLLYCHLSIYLGRFPQLGGSRQHKRNYKNNGGFTPFFQQCHSFI